MKWSEAYEHSGWTIIVPVKLVHAIGAKGAILVSQLFYWKGKEQSEDGWIYKTKAELEAETGLSRYEQDTCTEDLGYWGATEQKSHIRKLSSDFLVDVGRVPQGA